MMEKKETEDRRVEKQEGEPEPVEVVANALEADKTENGCSAAQDKEISAENGKPTSRFSQIVKKIAKHV